MASEDLIAAERRHADRVGEIYQIAYNPAHKWFYFPDMTRDEALVFKCYDSLKDGRARFYGPREVARMTLILRGRRFGFSLEEIRQWLEIYGTSGNAAQLKVWIEQADRQLLALQQQRDELEDTIRDLRKLRDETAESLS